MEKILSGWATDDNMTYAHCIRNSWGYKHTLRICNTHCIFIATMVARTCLSVTSYVDCMSCIFHQPLFSNTPTLWDTKFYNRKEQARAKLCTSWSFHGYGFHENLLGLTAVTSGFNYPPFPVTSMRNMMVGMDSDSETSLIVNTCRCFQPEKTLFCSPPYFNPCAFR